MHFTNKAYETLNLCGKSWGEVQRALGFRERHSVYRLHQYALREAERVM